MLMDNKAEIGLGVRDKEKQKSKLGQIEQNNKTLNIGDLTFGPISVLFSENHILSTLPLLQCMFLPLWVNNCLERHEFVTGLHSSFSIF